MAIFSRSKKKKPTPPSEGPEGVYTQQAQYHVSTVCMPQQGGYGPPPLPPRQEAGNITGHGQLVGWAPYGGAPQYVPYQQPYQQVFVANYLLPPPQDHTLGGKLALISSSMSNLPAMLHGPMPECIPGAHIFNDDIPQWHRQGTHMLNQSAALYDQISSKFNSVLSAMDGENFSGDERELWVYNPPGPQWQMGQQLQVAEKKNSKKTSRQGKDKDNGCPIASAALSSNYFAKVNLYANSRLPDNLPPVKLYIPTFPLLCLAAQYSNTVYSKPKAGETSDHVEADWRQGTKAMVLKSVPVDSKNVIVFAIRGSQSFLDWAVNLNSAPSAPGGFLDDGGNFCHAGFLSVARRMVKPVAARLRHLLQEDPRRSQCSLLITGHSAGGAIASLIYMHMLATDPSTQSELNLLTGCFKRIHCITFGAPPVSLLPLTKPRATSPTDPLRKSLFLSFVNEGDPVARADRAYVRSLLDLYSSPAPTSQNLLSMAANGSNTNSSNLRLKPPASNKPKSSSNLTLNLLRPSLPAKSKSSPAAPVLGNVTNTIWHVPASTLSNAGRLILLRGVVRPTEIESRRKDGLDDGVQARSITDGELRGVVWGDPMAHTMKLYKRRIEVLATAAVVGGG